MERKDYLIYTGIISVPLQEEPSEHDQGNGNGLRRNPMPLRAAIVISNFFLIYKSLAKASLVQGLPGQAQG